MKKTLTIIAMIIILGTMLFVLTGCGNSDNNSETNNNGNSSNNIVSASGEAWVNNSTNIAYIFQDGGTYKSYTLNNGAWISNGDGTYKIAGTSLTLDGTAYPYSIEGNNLILTISGSKYTYAKQPFTPIGTTAEESDKNLVLSSSQAWVEKDDVATTGYIFNSDGTYTYHWGDEFPVSSQGTWSTSGSTLTIKANDVDAQSYTYKISGDKLTITNAFGDSHTYTKQVKP